VGISDGQPGDGVALLKNQKHPNKTNRLMIDNVALNFGKEAKDGK